MKNNVTDYLRTYVDISEELEEVLTNLQMVKEFPKGTLLLQEGELCEACYFIVKGLVRSYYRNEEQEEVTTDFFMEESVVSPSCYGTETPSKNNYICQEDTIAFVGTPQMEEAMYAQYPELANMSRIIGEKIMSSHQDSFDQYKMATPEERYRNLIAHKPGLLQRVPQYQLASYLGMTPESLSRIRARIAKHS